MTDTIYALSSGALPAAIAVMRISGPAAFGAGERIAGPLPVMRRAAVRTLVDPVSGDRLDRALVLRFPAGGSVTGEDLVELHLHGSIAVVRAVEAVLRRIPGLRPATAGEFTRQALTNGRIDLTEAEGLADLLAAETEAQRQAAMRMADGSLRRVVAGWTTRLVSAAAQVEAEIEFAEDHDLAIGGATVSADLAGIAAEMETLLAAPTVDRLRDGFRVVLAGPPNAGKSTLFNLLIERDAAIVTPIAGTTLDVIEAPVTYAGIPYVVTDTAGLTETDDPVEAIGVGRAREVLERADIILWLGDDQPEHDQAIWVQPRIDIPGRTTVADGRIGSASVQPSTIAAVWQAISERALSLMPPVDTVAMNMRHHDIIARACIALRHNCQSGDILIIAEVIRMALTKLADTTGAGVEAVLDQVFARFCVGK